MTSWMSKSTTAIYVFYWLLSGKADAPFGLDAVT